MPLLQELYEKRQKEGIEVLLVHVGGSRAQVAQFQESRGLSLPILVDELQGVSGSYHIQYFPTTFFIDKDGVIRDKVIGAFMNLEQIETRLTNITGS